MRIGERWSGGVDNGEVDNSVDKLHENKAGVCGGASADNSGGDKSMKERTRAEEGDTNILRAYGGLLMQYAPSLLSLN